MQRLALMMLVFCVSVAEAACPLQADEIMGREKARFQNFRQMIDTLNGQWAGCDAAGNPASLRFAEYPALGRVANYKSNYDSYTSCTWSGQKSIASIENGSYSFQVTKMSCEKDSDGKAAPDSLTQGGAAGDLYAIGGKGKIDFLVVKLKGSAPAVLVRTGNQN